MCTWREVRKFASQKFLLTPAVKDNNPAYAFGK